MMVNSTGQRCSDMGSNVVLSISVRVFLDEIGKVD